MVHIKTEYLTARSLFVLSCLIRLITFLAQAMKIEAQSELERLTQAREAEMKYVKEQNDMEISKAREMADIETGKFNNMVKSIGPNTIQAIATSGPEMQVCAFNKMKHQFLEM